MKKWISVLLSVCMLLAAGIPVLAAEQNDGSAADTGTVSNDILWQEAVPVWSDGEEISGEFFARTEAVAAAAIVNTDSFVDKAADEKDFDVPCKAALLMDEGTGQILYAKNADAPLPIASITKVMTMLLVFEAIDAGRISLSDTVPITAHAYSMGGSQIWLEPGEIFTVDELLKAVAVSSANDAAVALAEYVGGSEAVFCDMMNKRAQQLGMENTHFVNACGLDAEGHLSSARDVALMSRELMKHEKVFDYTTIWMDYLRNGQTQLVNTNKMLHSYSGTTGLKTGTTGKAGVCISATAKRQDLSLIAVVLGSATGTERFDAAKKLLDFGFSNFESKPFPQLENCPEYIEVRYGVQKKAQISYTLPGHLLFLKGQAKELESRITLPEYVDAPMSEGTIIGSVGLYSAGQKIKEYDIILRENLEKVDFKKALEIIFRTAADMGGKQQKTGSF
ncbi:MAG: D-alanyl-D-alanine carboxypeptidase [Oscillospiraceae bacterium]|nr:D-alanyl-D-alanine carboxypeptidase [Oscillospiraceae bacterium]